MEHKLGGMRTELRAAATHGTESLTTAFTALLPAGLDAEPMVQDTVAKFNADEAPEVLAELAVTINATCGDDEFHTWHYDHLEFIIELSDRYRFKMPRNIVDGLPEQLALLVDSDNLADSGCE